MRSFVEQGVTKFRVFIYFFAVGYENLFHSRIRERANFRPFFFTRLLFSSFFIPLRGVGGKTISYKRVVNYLPHAFTAGLYCPPLSTL